MSSTICKLCGTILVTKNGVVTPLGTCCSWSNSRPLLPSTLKLLQERVYEFHGRAQRDAGLTTSGFDKAIVHELELQLNYLTEQYRDYIKFYKGESK